MHCRHWASGWAGGPLDSESRPKHGGPMAVTPTRSRTRPGARGAPAPGQAGMAAWGELRADTGMPAASASARPLADSTFAYPRRRLPVTVPVRSGAWYNPGAQAVTVAGGCREDPHTRPGFT